MADLDNFFAKKDKKKSKPKKFVPEDMAQMLEEAEKKQQEKELRNEQKKREANYEQDRKEQLESDDPNVKKETAEEWLVVEEVPVDLSDLNIQQLEQPEPEKPEAVAVDADGNPTAPSDAWKKKKKKAARDQSPDEAPKPEPEKKAPEPAKAPAPAPAASTAYVPPSMRNRPAGETAGGALAPTRLGATRSWRNKAPDVSSDEAFPALGAVVEEKAAGAWGKQRGSSRAAMPSFEEFQRVRGHGASGQNDRLSGAKGVSVGNQFDALQRSEAF